MVTPDSNSEEHGALSDDQLAASVSLPVDEDGSFEIDEIPVNEIPDDRLIILLESMLFVSPEPATIERLALALGVPEERVDRGLTTLAQGMACRGVRMQRSGDAVQLVSAPEATDAIEAYLGLDLSTKLSRAALEALAIIAYRQPATRPQIEAIRGVNSDGVIRTLLHRGLVEELGRLEQAGRPILYGTTFEFLQYFGLNSLEMLPPLEEDVIEELAARAQLDAEVVSEDEFEGVTPDESLSEPQDELAEQAAAAEEKETGGDGELGGEIDSESAAESDNQPGLGFSL